jgi:hypothetical protein
MNKLKLSQILAILVVFSLMSGCGSRASVKTATPVVPPTSTEQPATATLPPPTPPPTATPPPILVAVPIVPGSFPVGTYMCEQGKNKYTYKFLAEGRYTEEIIAYSGDAFMMESDAGIYTVSGNQIVITSVRTVGDCQADKIGTYTWSLDGQTLNFKSLGDKCAIREYTNEACKWVVQP